MSKKAFLAAFAAATIGAQAQTVSGKFNGHDYVDLGLKSGTLWATCNIGATTPKEIGDGFYWADTDVPATQVDAYREPELHKYFEKKNYDNSWHFFFSKYNEEDGKTVLEDEDDSAVKEWGGGYRTPT